MGSKAWSIPAGQYTTGPDIYEQTALDEWSERGVS